MAGAEPYKEQLMERGVLVVPLPIFEGPAAEAAPSGNGAASSSGNGSSQKDDLR